MAMAISSGVGEVADSGARCLLGRNRAHLVRSESEQIVDFARILKILRAVRGESGQSGTTRAYVPVGTGSERGGCGNTGARNEESLSLRG